jgi:von Willebrand factor type A domain/Aerotolerance regulator N-terminal
MIFAGLPLTTLLGMAAGMGVLTTLLYILKLRRRPVSVPFSPLWQRVLNDKQATHLFSQLRRWLSLLLQLCLIGLVLFALGDPRSSTVWTQNRNRVVLVDVSASMQATDVGPNRLAAARTTLQGFVQGLPAGDRLLIAEMGPSPRALSSMTDDPGELKRALESLRASDTAADLERGLLFARASLGALPNPEVMIVSDGALGDLERTGKRVDLSGVKLSYVPVGQSDRNVSVSQFSVRRYPLDKSRYEVLLEVSNTNDTPAEVELTLLGDGTVIDVTTLALGPKERLPRIYSDLSGASRTLEAKIQLQGEDPDKLAVDDHAYALMPERRRVRVLVVSPGNTYLEAALLLDEYLDVTMVAPDAPVPSATFDVTILDGVAPALSPTHGARLYLNPPDEGAPVKRRPKPIENFGFDTWDRKSPLLAFIAPEDIQVATGHALLTEPGDQIVGASELGPILVAGKRDGQRFAALGFDPRHSDLVLRVAWPLFLLNTINTFVAEDVRYLSSFRTGEVWHVPVAGNFDTVTLRAPDGAQREVPVKAGYAITFGEHSGFYSVLGADGAELHAFAANLGDPEESQLTHRPELSLKGAAATAADGFSIGVRRELWVILLCAALLLSLLEWFTYHRRLTV